MLTKHQDLKNGQNMKTDNLNTSRKKDSVLLLLIKKNQVKPIIGFNITPKH